MRTYLLHLPDRQERPAAERESEYYHQALLGIFDMRGIKIKN